MIKDNFGRSRIFSLFVESSILKVDNCNLKTFENVENWIVKKVSIHVFTLSAGFYLSQIFFYSLIYELRRGFMMPVNSDLYFFLFP